jgi:hypothetical protein
MSQVIDRRSLLKASASAGTSMILGGNVSAAPASYFGKSIRLGFVGVGNRGSYHLDCALGMEGVEVAAVCDIDDAALYRAKRWVEEAGQPSPHLYPESKTAFLQLCEKETLDCVICSTPWEYHSAICTAAMKNGKNAVSEVPIVLTLEEAWEIVETYEKTRKWATLGLEGFGSLAGFAFEDDLTLQNMVRKGILGDVLHAEGGYVHDLRMVKFNPMEEPWRLQHSATRNGNLYPDHPMAKLMPLLDINHGDRFQFLVSMSTKAVTLNKYAALKFGDQSLLATRKMAQGDLNVTLLRSVGGKMVTLNYDTNTPHPRDFFRLQGSKGVYQSGVCLAPPGSRDSTPTAPALCESGRGMIYIDGRTPTTDHWESVETYFREYQHPFSKAYVPKPRKRELRGHGGGETTTPVIWERLIAALRAGKMPDWDVYDSVTSSVISPLTEKSVAGGSIPILFPDFTKGRWQTAMRVEIV